MDNEFLRGGNMLPHKIPLKMYWLSKTCTIMSSVCKHVCSVDSLVLYITTGNYEVKITDKASLGLEKSWEMVYNLEISSPKVFPSSTLRDFGRLVSASLLPFLLT